MNTVEIIGLRKQYGQKYVLNDISLTIAPGEICGLLGENGAGKSTLIKLLSGLLVPDAGRILVNGHELDENSRKVIAYLPERTFLNREWRIQDALNFFETFYPDFERARAESMLEELGWKKEQKVSALSKGMQEKLQLILVMSRQADLYILDEPMGGVDPAGRERILDTILANFREKSSMLITTHLVADLERIFDRVLILDQGKIAVDESADELREKYGCSADQLFRRMMK